MLSATAAAAQRPAEPIAIVGAVVVDPRSSLISAAARAPQTIIISSGVIQSIGPTATTAVPRGMRRVNADGKFAIPGLWDAHVHFMNTGANALPVTLALGVTSVREMGGFIDSTRAWQKRMRAGTLDGPRILTPGPILEAPSYLDNVRQRSIRDPRIGQRVLPYRIGVGTAAQAKAAIDSLVKLHVDFVKIRTTESPEAYFAILREAKRAGLKVAGHQPSVVDLVTAIDSGQADINHAFVGLPSRMTLEARDTLYLEFARAGTWYTPTLGVSKAATLTGDSAMTLIFGPDVRARDERRGYASKWLEGWWRIQVEERMLDSNAARTAESARQAYASSVADVRRMRGLGVLMLAGTDAGSVLMYPGFALHEELALLVEDAGLTPAQALWSATAGPAKFAGMDKALGTIEKGKIADLVLLDANPLENIRNTRGISGVVQAGRYRARAELDAMLARARGMGAK